MKKNADMGYKKTNPKQTQFKAGSVPEKQFRKSEPANVQTCLQTGKGGSFLLTFFTQSGKLLFVQRQVVS
jgi:penicillin-binding protein-related factor A (putative recombinase)